MISVLLTDLAYQGDTEMRFLGIRLNYNEVLPSPLDSLDNPALPMQECQCTVCRACVDGSSTNLYHGQEDEIGPRKKKQPRNESLKIRESEAKEKLQSCRKIHKKQGPGRRDWLMNSESQIYNICGAWFKVSRYRGRVIFGIRNIPCSTLTKVCSWTAFRRSYIPFWQAH